MNAPISNVKTTPASPSEILEKEIKTDQDKSTAFISEVNSNKQFSSEQEKFLYKATHGPKIFSDKNFTPTNKPPEILAPPDFSLEITQILRLIQIEFCSADITYAASNGYQIQLGLEEQNQKRNNKELDIINDQNKVEKSAKITKQVGEALATIGVIFSLAGLFTAQLGIGLAIAALGLAFSAWALTASLIPEECRGERQNIFGETVKWDYSLSGLIPLTIEWFAQRRNGLRREAQPGLK